MNRSTRVYDNIGQMVASVEDPTPLVRINRLNPARDGFELFAKLEWYNPTGSIKDRAAWSMIQDMERRGSIDAAAGRGIVEPTSGNTGLSLAAIGGSRGHAVRVVVPRRVPTEKRAMLRLAGAQVDVINDQMCPAPGLGEGAINMARTHARAQADLYAMPNQYENTQNTAAHALTTGPEIWHQTAGQVTHVFAALGTCGTISGIARFLKSMNPAVRIVAVHPDKGHDLPGVRRTEELGVSALFDRSLIDALVEVDHRMAYRRAAELFRMEGFRAGPSTETSTLTIARR